MRESCRYEDIIDLPHPVSRKHAQMPKAERAAQFSPFAALTGYEEAVAETARLTESRTELDESRKLALGETLYRAQEKISERPEAAIVYFRPDERKEGGAYVSVVGRLRRVDEIGRFLLLCDGTRIPLDDLRSLDLTGEPLSD